MFLSACNELFVHILSPGSLFKKKFSSLKFLIRYLLLQFAGWFVTETICAYTGFSHYELPLDFFF